MVYNTNVNVEQNKTTLLPPTDKVDSLIKKESYLRNNVVAG